MTGKQGKKMKWPFRAGTLCIAVACIFILHNRLESRNAREQSEGVLTQLHALIPDSEAAPRVVGQTEPFPADSENAGGSPEKRIPDHILDPDMDMPTAEIDGNDYVGTLCFPSLGLELPVMSSWSYSNLRISPCLYTGSVYAGTAVIAAHNYTSHFYALFSLTPGDTVRFTDIDGNVFTYEVVVQEVLDPTAIQEMTGSGFALSLFTCTLGGASRFTVRCRLL